MKQPLALSLVAAVVLGAILILWMTGGPLDTERIAQSERPSGTASAAAEDLLRAPVERADPPPAKRTQAAADALEPWLPVLADRSLQGQSSEALWREFFGADFDWRVERLADPFALQRIRRVQTSPVRSGDIDDFLDAARRNLLNELADVDRLSSLGLTPGLPASPLSWLYDAENAGRATSHLFFRVQGNSKPIGLTLSKAQIDDAGQRVRAWRATHRAMRRELQVRLAAWVAEDLTGLSSTRPPRRGSLFVTPGKTSHPDPEVARMRQSLLEEKRRWLFEHRFAALHHPSWYAGSYSLRLDQLPQARATLGEFLDLEARLMASIEQLQAEFELALAAR